MVWLLTFIVISIWDYSVLSGSFQQHLNSYNTEQNSFKNFHDPKIEKQKVNEKQKPLFGKLLNYKKIAKISYVFLVKTGFKK